MPNVERTGERRLDYSRWHRERLDGKIHFATDVDWLEYRRGRESVALIETKYGQPTINRSQRTVMADLANRAGLPFFVVAYRYESESDFESWQFWIAPHNDIAERHPNTRFRIWISEAEYRRFVDSL